MVPSLVSNEHRACGDATEQSISRRRYGHAFILRSPIRVCPEFVLGFEVISELGLDLKHVVTVDPARHAFQRRGEESAWGGPVATVSVMPFPIAALWGWRNALDPTPILFAIAYCLQYCTDTVAGRSTGSIRAAKYPDWTRKDQGRVRTLSDPKPCRRCFPSNWALTCRARRKCFGSGSNADPCDTQQRQQQSPAREARAS